MTYLSGLHAFGTMLAAQPYALAVFAFCIAALIAILVTAMSFKYAFNHANRLLMLLAAGAAYGFQAIYPRLVDQAARNIRLMLMGLFLMALAVDESLLTARAVDESDAEWIGIDKKVEDVGSGEGDCELCQRTGKRITVVSVDSRSGYTKVESSRVGPTGAHLNEPHVSVENGSGGCPSESVRGPWKGAGADIKRITHGDGYGDDEFSITIAVFNEKTGQTKVVGWKLGDAGAAKECPSVSVEETVIDGKWEAVGEIVVKERSEGDGCARPGLFMTIILQNKVSGKSKKVLWTLGPGGAACVAPQVSY